MTAQSSAYTIPEFAAMIRRDRRRHVLPHICRRLIGFQATAYLFRLPHAGWYVKFRHYRTQTITTSGPFASRAHAEDHAQIMRLGGTAGVTPVFLWDQPPTFNDYMGFSYGGGWRQKYLPTP